MALEPSVGPEPELLDGRQTLPWDYFPLARDPLNGWQLEAVSQTTSYFGAGAFQRASLELQR